MDYTPISPFMRRISHAHLSPVLSDSTLPARPVNKWHLLRELSKAKATFGVSDRDLTVLQGLFSFFPHDCLDESTAMIVFPANRTICERLNGMALSTMRRHLARLVEAGLLIRRDSPNGKRYVRKSAEGHVAFGFDLTPLLHRSEEIGRAAEAAREAEMRVRELREVVSLMRRDLVALAEFGSGTRPELVLWHQMREHAASVARALRRKLSADALTEQRGALLTLLDKARNVVDEPETHEMSTCHAQIERHHLNTDKESIAFEPAEKTFQHDIAGPNTALEEFRLDDSDGGDAEAPAIPLHLVLEGCPSLKTFYPGEIRHWHQLYAAACHIRPAMGISLSAWDEARRLMGAERASITVAVILERFAEIRSPGGYLRALTEKAAAGKLSCGPMVMAQLNRARAA